MKRLDQDFRRHAEKNEAGVDVRLVSCVCKEIRYLNMKLRVA